VTQVVDFYLDDKYTPEREQIVKLSKKTDAASAELLRGYVREAMSASCSISISHPKLSC
jgi:hypothetical protein